MRRPAESARAGSDPFLGRVVEGYRLVRLVGSGGMGSVYEALDERSSQRVAIKVLFAEFSRDEISMRRFIDEASAASRVEHPGLVKVYSHGRLEDGTAFISMEFLAGESLQARLDRVSKEGQRLPVAQVLTLARQITSTLVAVHRGGIVHRDLKPGNLIVMPVEDLAGVSEHVKIVDFGIAKFDASSSGGVANTTVGRFLGTALYASPEQCQMAGQVGTKADVYSLGVVIYEMLAGRPPFVADQPGMVIGMHLFREPAPLLDLVLAAPAELCQLVHRMLAKAPGDRPSMEQVLAQLDTVRLDRRPRMLRGRLQRRLILGLSAAFGLLAAGGTAYWVHAHARTARSTAEAASQGTTNSDRLPNSTSARKPDATKLDSGGSSPQTGAGEVNGTALRSVGKSAAEGSRSSTRSISGKPPSHARIERAKPASPPQTISPPVLPAAPAEPQNPPPPKKRQRTDHEDAFY